MTKQSNSNLNQWKSAKRHTVTLHSGAVVEFEVPNLPLLIKTGRIPQPLIEHALSLQTKTKVSKEDIEDQYEFYRVLVPLVVKVPELTPEDVDLIPFEDVEMIVEFATRQRDIDAVGHHIGGLEKIESFRELRGL